MRTHNALLILEAALVTLIVGVISLFIVRGYHSVLRAERTAAEYVVLAEKVEEKIWQKEMDQTLPSLAEDAGVVSRDTTAPGVKEARVSRQVSGRRFDVLVYLEIQEK